MLYKKRPSRIYVKGVGPLYQMGGNVFLDTLKTLGRKINFRDFFGKFVKPFAKKGLEIGKDLYKENKQDIQKIMANETKNIINKLTQKPTKQILKQTKENIKEKGRDLLNKNKDMVIKKYIDPMLEGEGIKKRLLKGRGLKRSI